MPPSFLCCVKPSCSIVLLPPILARGNFSLLLDPASANSPQVFLGHPSKSYKPCSIPNGTVSQSLVAATSVPTFQPENRVMSPESPEQVQQVGFLADVFSTMHISLLSFFLDDSH